MLSYVLGTLVILLLVILFRYLPHRVFLIFVTLLFVLVGVIFYMQTAERTQEPLTVAERAAITHDQDIFMPWWETYQKQIAELIMFVISEHYKKVLLCYCVVFF